MSPLFSQHDLVRRYRAARAQGLPATLAHLAATSPGRKWKYRTADDGAIRFDLDNPGPEGFVVTAITEPDCDPDWPWLGKYTHTWSPGVIRTGFGQRRAPYFQPARTAAQYRADLSARGYARGPAQLLADHQVREDFRLFTELDARIVRVEVRKAGLLLGSAVAAAQFSLHERHSEALADVAAELIDDALSEARTHLPNLIAALTRAGEPGQAAPTLTHIEPVTSADRMVRAAQDCRNRAMIRLDAAKDASRGVFVSGAEQLDAHMCRDDIEVTVTRGDDNCRLIQIDTFAHTGPIRINVNDGPAVYHCDPASGEHFTGYTA